MNDQWPKDVQRTLEALAKLPRVRYAFVPGFERNREGNSAPGSRLVQQNGELALVTAFRSEPTPLRAVFEGYTLSVVTDGNGYTCVRGIDENGAIRELAPLVKSFYGDDADRKLIRENLVPDESKAL